MHPECYLLPLQLSRAATEASTRAAGFLTTAASCEKLAELNFNFVQASFYYFLSAYFAMFLHGQSFAVRFGAKDSNHLEHEQKKQPAIANENTNDPALVLYEVPRLRRRVKVELCPQSVVGATYPA